MIDRFEPAASYAISIAVDKAGYIYVSDSGLNRVLKFPPIE